MVAYLLPGLAFPRGDHDETVRPAGGRTSDAIQSPFHGSEPLQVMRGRLIVLTDPSGQAIRLRDWNRPEDMTDRETRFSLVACTKDKGTVELRIGLQVPRRYQISSCRTGKHRTLWRRNRPKSASAATTERSDATALEVPNPVAEIQRLEDLAARAAVPACGVVNPGDFVCKLNDALVAQKREA